jgi:hypothetical protein
MTVDLLKALTRLSNLSGSEVGHGVEGEVVRAFRRYKDWTLERSLVLRDAYNDGGKDLALRIQESELGILVNVAGYGEFNAVCGDAWPILIENQGGEPVVVVWSDIGREDPTHSISLEGAAEEKRRESRSEE